MAVLARIRWYAWPLLMGCCTVALFALLFLQQPAFAQSTPPSAPTPTPASNPPVDAAAAQQAQIEDLKQTVRELAQANADTRRVLDEKLFFMVVIGGVLTLAGLKTYGDLEKIIRQKISATLDKELYQLDPTMLTIYLPRELERERTRLELSGLKNVKTYTQFNSKASRRGITIVPVRSPEEEQAFLKFLDAAKSEFDPTQAAFILYAPDKHRVDTETTMKAFDNLSLANTPTTLAGAVLVVARGLKTIYSPRPSSPIYPV